MTRPGHMINEDLGTSGRFQDLNLMIRILLQFRYTGITDTLGFVPYFDLLIQL